MSNLKAKQILTDISERISDLALEHLCQTINVDEACLMTCSECPFDNSMKLRQFAASLPEDSE